MVRKKAERSPSTRGAPAPEEMRELPYRLRHAMKVRGITQKKLEEMSGVSQPTISPLTRDPVPEGVTAAVICHLAKALNVSLNYLLMGAEEALPVLPPSRSQAELPKERPLRLDENTIPSLYSVEAKAPEAKAPAREPARGRNKRS